jgi:hypothetical protein
MPTISTSVTAIATEGGQAVPIIVQLSEPAPAGGLEVAYSWLGSASPLDYTVAAGTGISSFSTSSMRIAAGATQASLLVTASIDAALEPSEYLRLVVNPGTGYTVANAGMYFATPLTLTTAASNPHVVVGDFDGDRRLDVVGVNEDAQKITWLKGDGAGGFDAGVQISVGGKPSDASVGDFNLDGFSDLAVTLINSNQVAIALGSVNGLGAWTTYGVGNSPRYSTTGDFNGDGLLDLAVANLGQTVSVLIGNGSGAFDVAKTYASGGAPHQPVAVDVNRDGRQDIALADMATGKLLVHLTDANGALGSASSYTVGSSPQGVTSGDFNGDGLVDVAVANRDSNSVSVLLANATGGFSAATNIAVGFGPTTLSAADLDGDGVLGLVVANRADSTIQVLKGLGNGQFVSVGAFSLGSDPYGIATGDFDRDGADDVVAGARGGSALTVGLSRPQPDALLIVEAESELLDVPTIYFDNHIYQYFSIPGGTAWTTSFEAASTRSLNGLRGYLATITSAAEQLAIFEAFGSFPDTVEPRGTGNTIALGGSDSAKEGEWRWVAGPESGQLFNFNNWREGEPNNGWPGQHFLQIVSVWGGAWDDVWDNPLSVGSTGTITGYIVEYGGLPSTYAIFIDSDDVNEGSSVTFTIDTTNVEWGTALSYTLSGISQSDLSSGALTGTAIVQQRDTDGRATVTVQLAADQTTEGIETLTLTVEGVSASVEVVDISPIAPANGMSGIAYHWKSHTLLDKVAVQAVDQEAVSDTPTQLFDLRAAVLDPRTGKLTVEVWANPGATVETIDFTASGPTGSIFTFTSTLGADWTPLTNTSQPGQLLLGAYLSSLTATGLTVPTQVGTLEVQLAVGATDVQIAFSEVQVGASSVPDLALGMAGTTTAASGAFEFTTLPAGHYGLSATRAAGDGSNGVTSADALAALRLAVGINPNTDPDGAGPQEALKVSPYQFMAADANQDGKVSAADALAILRMAVKLPSAVPQEWFFVEETRDLWNEITGQSALTRTAATWDRSINATAPGEVNLVGVLKGDVNGSWTAPAGAQDLDVLEPGYFADLAQRIGAPLDQFGVYSGG